jgi:hypothetical protein
MTTFLIYIDDFSLRVFIYTLLGIPIYKNKYEHNSLFYHTTANTYFILEINRKEQFFNATKNVIWLSFLFESGFWDL